MKVFGKIMRQYAECALDLCLKYNDDKVPLSVHKDAVLVRRTLVDRIDVMLIPTVLKEGNTSDLFN